MTNLGASRAIRLFRNLHLVFMFRTKKTCRVSSFRSESVLDSISYGVGLSQEAACDVQAQLSNIQQTVSEIKHAVQSQNAAVNCAMGVVSSCGENAICMNERKLSAKPTCTFETWRSFYPEIYTTDQRLPTFSLFVIGAYERFSSAQLRKNVYKFLFLKSHRRWCTLTIFLQIERSSRYWIATEIPKIELKRRGAVSLVGSAQIPRSLLRQIQRRVSVFDELGEDDIIDLDILNEGGSNTPGDVPPPTFQPTISRPPNSCEGVLTFLDDLGCPRFVEDQVTQIEMLDPPNRFASCIKGRFVYEIKFSGSLPNAELLYNVQALHCMSGIPGFAKFLGIVVDRAGKYLKSYLIDLPQRSCRFDLILHKKNIPWSRREKWARQLVNAVRHVHAKGLVIGTQNGFSAPVVLESSDNIEFWAFKKTFELGCHVDCYYPPECSHLQEVSPTAREAESPAITSKTDIFQLGLLLWILAENVTLSSGSPVCIREGCKLRGESCR